MKFKTIAVVGLGLMGGSLAAACRKKFPQSRILGVSRNASALRLALRNKWIHQGSSDLSIAKSADLIILCTPVDTLKSFLSRLDKIAKPGALVMDVGSVKGSIVGWAARQRFKNIRFVGAHPMAGSHVKGIEAASAHLYEKSLVFLVPVSRSNAQALKEAKLFWKKITGRVVEIEAGAHDRVVSEISHLPHAIAVGLVLAVSKTSLPFVASGFRDTTRIAQGHPSIWLPIFQTNRKAVVRSLNAFEGQLKKIKLAINSKNGRALKQLLAQAARARQAV